VAADEPALSSLLRPIRGRLVLAALVQAAAAVLGVVPFVAVAELGRTLLSPGPVDHGRAVLAVLVAACSLAARVLLLIAASTISHVAENEFQLDVRRRLVDRLGRLPLGWFGETNSGMVKKSVQDDVDQMHHLVAHSLLELVSAVTVPLVSLGYLFWVDWRMSLVLLVPLVLGVVLYARTGNAFMRNLAAMDSATAQLNASAVEFVRGIAVIKTFGQAGRAHRAFAKAADEFADFFMSWVAKLIGPRAASELVLSPVTMTAAVLVGGAAFVTSGWLRPVDLLPFLLVGVGLSAPIATVLFAEQEVRAAQAAAARVTGLLAAPELPAPDDPQKPQDDRVVIDAVDFSYDGENQVLRHIDVELRPGTVTALVGPSGAGKSTIASLLPRFWDVTSGAIRLGGVDLRRLAPADLYRRVAFVFQEVRLLRETVEDNIRLARPTASRAEVEAAAREAQIHDRIMALPRGYDSVIGDDARLSGGEAQRVSIARALLADAPIIVLDEATVFVDPDSEAAIQEALSRLTADRTVLVIAHRLATVADADQIAVLVDGRIAELGTHADLLARDGVYTRLWSAYEASTRLEPRTRHAGTTEGFVR
jgi:ATP-binding cassette subfamily B protein